MNKKLALACAAALCSTSALAQSNMTIYGNVDQYVGHISSGNDQSITELYDGALLRSRLGFKGTEDLGGGLQAKFNLEAGLDVARGEPADDSRLFDRQAWVGLNTRFGEFRIGRQNTQIQTIGSATDYTGRTTFGSIINLFGMPSRYDGDFSYRSPRLADFQFVFHYAFREEPDAGASESNIYQLGVDWTRGDYQIGYAGLGAEPVPDGPIQNRVQYHTVYANYDYGRGKVYFAAVRSNNVTAATSDEGTTNNAGAILSNVGNPDNSFPGTNPDVRRFYHIYQLSADYKINAKIRVGALYGVIQDQSDAENDAHGGNIGVFYDFSKRTTLYGFANYLKNENDAGFRFSGSASPNPNLVGADVNGESMTGYQLGILHRF